MLVRSCGLKIPYDEEKYDDPNDDVKEPQQTKQQQNVDWIEMSIHVVRFSVLGLVIVVRARNGRDQILKTLF